MCLHALEFGTQACECLCFEAKTTIIVIVSSDLNMLISPTITGKYSFMCMLTMNTIAYMFEITHDFMWRGI